MQGKRQNVLERSPGKGPIRLSPVRPVPFVRPVSPIARDSSPHYLMGISPESVLALVERLESIQGGRWQLWGSVHGRPILFDVDEARGREMLDAVAKSEDAVAIVEPWELLGQPLD